MIARNIKAELEAYHKGTGYNNADLIKHLKSYDCNGYDESYDGSMLSKQIGNLLVIVSPSSVMYHIAKEV